MHPKTPVSRLDCAQGNRGVQIAEFPASGLGLLGRKFLRPRLGAGTRLHAGGVEPHQRQRSRFPMKWTKQDDRSCAPPRRFRRLGWMCGCAILLFLVAVVVAARQAPQSSQPQGNGNTPTQEPGGGRASASSPLAVPDAQNGQNLDAVNTQRKKQLAADSARLLKL